MNIENMTNEEAVAYYGPLTREAIPCGDLENLLDWAGLANRNAVTGAWEGTLVDAMAIGGPLGDGLAELFQHLNKPRSMNIDSDTQPWAAKMAGLLGGLQLAGLLTPAVAASVVALGGGYLYPGLDEDAVQAKRDSEAVEAALVSNEKKFDALYNEHVSPLIDSKNISDTDWANALQAMSSNWSN